MSIQEGEKERKVESFVVINRKVNLLPGCLNKINLLDEVKHSNSLIAGGRMDRILSSSSETHSHFLFQVT